MQKKQLEIILEGRVQGIGFRWTIKNYAQKNNLTGWVMNLEEGSIKAIIQGNKEDLDKFLEWMKNSPGFSKVTSLDFKINKPKEIFKDFSIKREYPLFQDKSRSFINLGKSIFNHGD